MIKRIYAYWLVIFVFLIVLTDATAKYDNFVDEAFVTFATASHFALLEVLIKSVHAFSTRPVVAFGVNEDIPFSEYDYPRLIKRRIDYDFKKSSIFYLKPRIILDSNIRYGVYVEADDILNVGIDNLFDLCRTIKDYPLCPIHPRDPDNQQSIMHAMGVLKKSMPYVHGHVLFSAQCRPFIQDWYDMCLQYHYLNPVNYDETVLNVLLWKHGVSKYIPIFDPYYGYFYEWIKGIFLPNVNYYTFHGCKKVVEAQRILSQLIALHKDQQNI